jgi:hypothetical protein
VTGDDDEQQREAQLQDEAQQREAQQLEEEQQRETEEKQETKQHTAMPATAAFVAGRSPIVADSASTGTQSEEDLMGRWGRGPPACAQVVASLLRVEVGACEPVPWNALGLLEAVFWDTDALNALEDAFWSLRAHAVDGLPPVVVLAAADCLWMARGAIEMSVRALRVRLHLVTVAGSDWDMESLDVCPVAEIMNHIDACVCACAEITGNDDLGSVDFLDDVTDPASLAEAICSGANVNHITDKSTSNCGLGGGCGAVVGELLRISAASS